MHSRIVRRYSIGFSTTDSTISFDCRVLITYGPSITTKSTSHTVRDPPITPIFLKVRVLTIIWPICVAQVTFGSNLMHLSTLPSQICAVLWIRAPLQTGDEDEWNSQENCSWDRVYVLEFTGSHFPGGEVKQHS